MRTNRLKKLLETFSTIKKGWDSVFLKFGFSKERQVMEEPYRNSDLVYICISTTARAISQVPLKVYDIQEDEKQPVGKDHPWQRLFHRPNYLMDQYSFIEAIVSYLMLDGHVWIIPFPLLSTLPKNTVPDSLWVVNKRNMEPIRDSSTGHLVGWRYRPSAVSRIRESVELEADDVISIWFWNPYDPVLGLSPLEAGKMTIITDYKAAYYNAVFFDEGSVPSGVLTTEQRLGDKQFERLREQIESRHKGYMKSHRLMILEQGLKYQPLGLTHKDMEFYDLRRFNQERILQIFGMKKVIISVTDDLNYATAREQRKEWWLGTNIPIMRLIQSALNFGLFRETSYVVEFDLTTVEALQEDLKDKVETAERLAKLGFTANEINERLNLGFEPKPWRDYWYAPANVIPMGGEEEKSKNEIEFKIEKKSEEKKDFSAEQEKIFEAYWKAFVKETKKIENELEGKVKKIFYKMRKKSLKLLYRGEKSVDDLNKEEFQEERNELKRVVGLAYAKAMKKGAEMVAEELGIIVNFDLNDSAAISFLAEKLPKVVGIVDTVKRQLAKTLSEGMSKGESIDQLADRVRKVFNAASHRARTIARTEVVGAANFGRHQQIMASDYTEVMWFTALDERVRMTHRGMHGKKKRKGDFWIVGGASLRYPGDPAGPPQEIINCRCIEVVVPGSLKPPTGKEEETTTDFRKKRDKLLDKYRKIEKANVDTLKRFSKELRQVVDETGGVEEIDLKELMLATEEEIKKDFSEIFSPARLSKEEGKKFVQAFKFAGRFFNREVRKKLKEDKIYVRKAEDRVGAWYMRTERIIYLGRRINNAARVHEYGHHIEWVLDVKNLCRQWRDKRAIESVGRIIEIDLGGVNGKAVKGRFIDRYVGKTYNHGATEVLSMGLQQFYSEKSLRKFMQKDWEHFSLIYGILTGALK